MGFLISIIGSVVLTYVIIIVLLNVGTFSKRLGPLGPFEKAGPYGLVLVVCVAGTIWFFIFFILFSFIVF
ncbi:MAG: hypothetical protein MK025_04045 [Acidobacteriia bacterium]|nr:hypothetical protein [Terriglobia bacterium]